MLKKFADLIDKFNFNQPKLRLYYFPIQKLLKMFFKISSVAT